MAKTAEPPKTFEAALAELEALVASMEDGQMPLQASLASYKRGAELIAGNVSPELVLDSLVLAWPLRRAA